MDVQRSRHPKVAHFAPWHGMAWHDTSMQEAGHLILVYYDATNREFPNDVYFERFNDLSE